jgi:hypothetical protein
VNLTLNNHDCLASHSGRFNHGMSFPVSPYTEHNSHPHGVTAPRGPRFPYFQNFRITLTRSHTHTRTHTHKHTYAVGILWTSDQPDARPLTYKIRHSQETHIHALGEIRTHNPSKRVALNPRLRPQSHGDRHTKGYRGEKCHLPLQTV